MVVQTVRLDEVYDVEPVKSARPRVRNLEVVPLRVSPRVIVRL